MYLFAGNINIKFAENRSRRAVCGNEPHTLAYVLKVLSEMEQIIGNHRACFFNRAVFVVDDCFNKVKFISCSAVGNGCTVVCKLKRCKQVVRLTDTALNCITHLPFFIISFGTCRSCKNTCRLAYFNACFSPSPNIDAYSFILKFQVCRHSYRRKCCRNHEVRFLPFLCRVNSD